MEQKLAHKIKILMLKLTDYELWYSRFNGNNRPKATQLTPSIHKMGNSMAMNHTHEWF